MDFLNEIKTRFNVDWEKIVNLEARITGKSASNIFASSRFIEFVLHFCLIFWNLKERLICLQFDSVLIVRCLKFQNQR